MMMLDSDMKDYGICYRSPKDTNTDPAVSVMPPSAVRKVYKPVFRTLWSLLIVQSLLKDLSK